MGRRRASRYPLTDPTSHSISGDLVLNCQLLGQDGALLVLNSRLLRDGAIAIFGPGTRRPVPKVDSLVPVASTLGIVSFLRDEPVRSRTGRSTKLTLVLNCQFFLKDGALLVLNCGLLQDGAIAIFGPGTRIPLAVREVVAKLERV